MPSAGDITVFQSVIEIYMYSICRADSRLAHSQWETSLQSNAVSHWLGANLELALYLASKKGSVEVSYIN